MNSGNFFSGDQSILLTSEKHAKEEYRVTKFSATERRCRLMAASSKVIPRRLCWYRVPPVKIYALLNSCRQYPGSHIQSDGMQH